MVLGLGGPVVNGHLDPGIVDIEVTYPCDLEAQMLELVNKERASAGLKPLDLARSVAIILDGNARWARARGDWIREPQSAGLRRSRPRRRRLPASTQPMLRSIIGSNATA